MIDCQAELWYKIESPGREPRRERNIMGKVFQRTPTRRKESKQELSELEAAASALRENFFEKFRTMRYANARKLYDENCQWVVFFEQNIYPKPADYSPLAQSLRNNFHKQLDVWYRGFPELCQEFVRGLYQLRGDIECVKREAEKISLLKEEHQEWVVVACDGHEGIQDWGAPRWLLMWPVQLEWPALSATEFEVRLDAGRTEEVLRTVGSRVQKHLARALRGPINDVRIQLAHENEGARHGSTEVLRPKAAGPVVRGNHDPETETDVFVHSADYRSVSFRGKKFALTARQAQVVEMLHEAYVHGTPELSTHYVLEQLGTRNSRLRDTFKKSELWGTLVVTGKRRGTLRLDLSPKSKK